jgi:hypothetical protein
VKNVQPTLVSADSSSRHTVLGFFLQFLPMESFKRTTILQATNKMLSDALTLDEFLCFILILLLFGTIRKGVP